MNVLFVCSRNQWRSPTGERIWRKHAEVHSRSAGTSSSARRRLSTADLNWADLVLVMEDKHSERIRSDFRAEARHKDIRVLDIPDEYQFMDGELAELLRDVAGAAIDDKLATFGA